MGVAEQKVIGYRWRHDGKLETVYETTLDDGSKEYDAEREMNALIYSRRLPTRPYDVVSDWRGLGPRNRPS